MRIERGRYERPKLDAEQRMCLICNSGENEDEEHFLIHCNVYDNERLILLPSCSNIINNIHNIDKGSQFIHIMSNTDLIVQTSLSNYIYIYLL